MKQEPFVLHDHIAPLQMWVTRCITMIREAASQDLPEPAKNALCVLACDMEIRATAAWKEIEQAARKELQHQYFGYSNPDGGQKCTDTSPF